MKIRSLVQSLALGGLVGIWCLPVPAQGLRAAPGAALNVPATDGPSSSRSADYIVAVVNSDPITNHQVRQEAQRLARQIAQSRQSVPDSRELLANALERLIHERTQLQLAKELGIRVDDAAVDEAELSIARQNQLDLPTFHKRLAADGLDRGQFRRQLRDQILLNKVRDREVTQRVKVTEQDIDQFLRDQQRQAAGSAATDLHLAHVLVALPDAPTQAQVEAAREKAARILERARSGEDFAALARTQSDAPDAASAGGQLGMRPVDRLPPLFVEAVQALPIGGLATVRSGAGIHVLKLLERRGGGVAPTTVDQTLASHILLRVTPQMSEAAARERLAALRARIVAGQADFAAAAREQSQDGSAAQGGDLGWANPGQFVPEFEDAMHALAPGQISEPVVSRFGVHLIMVRQRRTAELSQREQREAIRAQLRERKIDENFATWAQDLRARAYVEMRESPG